MPKTIQKDTKIGQVSVKFSPSRRKIGKNLIGCTKKGIYRRFRISNQIFDSSYGSGDIVDSLDTTLAIFGKNLNFVDEYLQNG